MKRFYKMVSLGREAKGYTVLLDGKPVKTPGRSFLCTENEDLATAIMQEWARQGEKISLGTMILTQLLSTKIDRVSVEREAMTAALMKYLDTDLICYRGGHPPEIITRQENSWNPWLEWFEKEFGARLLTTNELKALAQPEAAHKAVLAFIENLDDHIFTVLQLVTPLSGSVVLGLAFVKQAITAEETLAAARVEERFKARLYNETLHGPDPMQEKRDAAAIADLNGAAVFLGFFEGV